MANSAEWRRSVLSPGFHGGLWLPTQVSLPQDLRLEDSTIHLIKKEGSAAGLVSRVETDNRLRGTKQIIVKNGNVFIGKGKRDNRSILVIPVMSAGTKIDHLVLFNVAFRKEVELQEKVDALGGKYHHIRNLVEETSLAWSDEHLDLLEIEELFGMSAEKIAEAVVSGLKNRSTS